MALSHIQKWRRSYYIRPPAITMKDDRYPDKVVRYAALLSEEIPLTESLEDTVNCFLPYWKSTIAPEIKRQSVRPDLRSRP